MPGLFGASVFTGASSVVSGAASALTEHLQAGFPAKLLQVHPHRRQQRGAGQDHSGGGGLEEAVPEDADQSVLLPGQAGARRRDHDEPPAPSAQQGADRVHHPHDPPVRERGGAALHPLRSEPLPHHLRAGILPGDPHPGGELPPAPGGDDLSGGAVLHPRQGVSGATAPEDDAVSGAGHGSASAGPHGPGGRQQDDPRAAGRLPASAGLARGSRLRPGRRGVFLAIQLPGAVRSAVHLHGVQGPGGVLLGGHHVLRDRVLLSGVLRVRQPVRAGGRSGVAGRRRREPGGGRRRPPVRPGSAVHEVPAPQAAVLRRRAEAPVHPGVRAADERARGQAGHPEPGGSRPGEVHRLPAGHQRGPGDAGRDADLRAGGPHLRPKARHAGRRKVPVREGRSVRRRDGIVRPRAGGGRQVRHGLGAGRGGHRQAGGQHQPPVRHLHGLGSAAAGDDGAGGHHRGRLSSGAGVQGCSGGGGQGAASRSGTRWFSQGIRSGWSLAVESAAPPGIS